MATENDGINAFIPQKEQPLPDKVKGKIRETLRCTTRNVPLGKNKEYEEDELLSRETKNCSIAHRGDTGRISAAGGCFPMVICYLWCVYQISRVV